MKTIERYQGLLAILLLTILLMFLPITILNIADVDYYINGYGYIFGLFNDDATIFNSSILGFILFIFPLLIGIVQQHLKKQSQERYIILAFLFLMNFLYLFLISALTPMFVNEAYSSLSISVKNAWGNVVIIVILLLLFVYNISKYLKKNKMSR